MWEAGIGTKAWVSLSECNQKKSASDCTGIQLQQIYSRAPWQPDWELVQDALAGTSMCFLPFSDDSSFLFWSSLGWLPPLPFAFLLYSLPLPSSLSLLPLTRCLYRQRRNKTVHNGGIRKPVACCPLAGTVAFASCVDVNSVAIASKARRLSAEGRLCW